MKVSQVSRNTIFKKLKWNCSNAKDSYSQEKSKKRIDRNLQVKQDFWPLVALESKQRVSVGTRKSKIRLSKIQNLNLSTFKNATFRNSTFSNSNFRDSTFETHIFVVWLFEIRLFKIFFKSSFQSSTFRNSAFQNSAFQNSDISTPKSRLLKIRF